MSVRVRLVSSLGIGCRLSFRVRVTVPGTNSGKSLSANCNVAKHLIKTLQQLS